MRRPSNVTTDTVYWVQPRMGEPRFELFDDGRVIGKLNWEKGVTERATATIVGNRWTIERVTFQTTVRDAESESDIAIYDSQRSFWSIRGKLTLWHGTAYRSRKTGNFFQDKWGFGRPDGQTLIHFKPEPGGMFFKKMVRVEIVPEAHMLLELPLLLVLGAFVEGNPTFNERYPS